MRNHVDFTHAELLEEERNASNAKRKEIAKFRVRYYHFYMQINFIKLEPQLKRCDTFIDDIICEAIGMNKTICFDELIRVAEFDADFPMKRFRTEEARQRSMRLNLYYQYVKIFTADKGNQWFEITDGIYISKLDPVWFSGHRVYEIPVKVRSPY